MPWLAILSPAKRPHVAILIMGWGLLLAESAQLLQIVGVDHQQRPAVPI